MTQIRPNGPDAAALSGLRDFLGSLRCPDGTLRFEELNGFLFAISCSPALVPPSAWLPVVFGGAEPSFEDPTQASSILGALLQLYNAINDDVLSARVGLPEGCAPGPDPLANLAPESPIRGWSRGFLLGHQYTTELWEEHTPADFSQELGSIVMILTFFADPELAASYHREFDTGGHDLEHMAKSLLGLLPQAMREYAQLGRALYQARLERPEKGRPARRQKVGRNEPCPCGSAKKYKKCCGARIH